MKEYENAEFADFLRMLGGLISKGQDAGELDDGVPAHIVARMIFGMLDELALAWVLALAPNTLLIPGTASLAHLEENLATATVDLDDESRAVLDAIGC